MKKLKSLWFHIIQSTMQSTQVKKSPNLINQYVGQWKFKDQTQSVRGLQVSKGLNVMIDDYPLETKIKSINSTKLSLIDRYGFLINIYSKEQKPSSIFDESMGKTYRLYQ